MDARRTAWVVAGFATALFVALVVCAYGFVSLLADVEPVADRSVSVVVAPFAVGASALVLLVVLGFRLARPERLAGTVVFSAAASWVALVLAGIAAHLVTSTGSVLESVTFGVLFGIGWFGLLIPAAAVVVAVLAVFVARGRQHGMERPRWPWEHDDEE